MKTHGNVTLQHNHTAQADLSVNHRLFLISRAPLTPWGLLCVALFLTFTLQYPDTTWCLQSDRDRKREFYTSTSAAGNESPRPRIPVNQYQYVEGDWKHTRTPMEVVPHTQPSTHSYTYEYMFILGYIVKRIRATWDSFLSSLSFKVRILRLKLELQRIITHVNVCVFLT